MTKCLQKLLKSGQDDFTCVLKRLYLPPGCWCQTYQPSDTEPKDLPQAPMLALNALNLTNKQKLSRMSNKVTACNAASDYSQTDISTNATPVGRTDQ